jgi:hypothetical protein
MNRKINRLNGKLRRIGLKRVQIDGANGIIRIVDYADAGDARSHLFESLNHFPDDRELDNRKSGDVTPGRARLSTKPDPKKSLATATIGIERVNCVKTGIIRALTEGTDDAHSTLRRLYLDEAQNPNTRVRAAQAALNVEKPRLAPVEPPLELVAEVIEPLADVVARQRARCDRMIAEEQSQGLRSSGYLLKGNGSDGDTGS